VLIRAGVLFERVRGRSALRGNERRTRNIRDSARAALRAEWQQLTFMRSNVQPCLSRGQHCLTSGCRHGLSAVRRRRLQYARSGVIHGGAGIETESGMVRHHTHRAVSREASRCACCCRQRYSERRPPCTEPPRYVVACRPTGLMEVATTMLSCYRMAREIGELATAMGESVRPPVFSVHAGVRPAQCRPPGIHACVCVVCVCVQKCEMAAGKIGGRRQARGRERQVCRRHPGSHDCMRRLPVRKTTSDCQNVHRLLTA